jgi:hypothetical protein
MTDATQDPPPSATSVDSTTSAETSFGGTPARSATPVGTVTVSVRDLFNAAVTYPSRLGPASMPIVLPVHLATHHLPPRRMRSDRDGKWWMLGTILRYLPDLRSSDADPVFLGYDPCLFE